MKWTKTSSPNIKIDFDNIKEADSHPFPYKYWEIIIWEDVDKRIKMRDYPWLYPR